MPLENDNRAISYKIIIEYTVYRLRNQTASLVCKIIILSQCLLNNSNAILKRKKK